MSNTLTGENSILRNGSGKSCKVLRCAACVFEVTRSVCVYACLCVSAVVEGGFGHQLIFEKRSDLFM